MIKQNSATSHIKLDVETSLGSDESFVVSGEVDHQKSNLLRMQPTLMPVMACDDESSAVSREVDHQKETRNWYIWLASGIAVVLLQQVMISSARKCLPSTGLVQCLLFGPQILVNGTNTTWSKWIGYSNRLYLQVALSFLSLGLITSAILEQEEVPEDWFCWRNMRVIIGLCSAAISTSIGYFNYSSLQSFYSRECVSGYVAGTGIGGMVGALWVATYQKWLKVDTENNTGYLNDGQMFLFLIPLPFISLWTFLQFDPKDWKHKSADLEEVTLGMKTESKSDKTISDVSEQGLGMENLGFLARQGRTMSLLWCTLFYYSVPLFINYFVYCILNAAILSPTYHGSKMFWPVFQMVIRFGSMLGKMFGKQLSDNLPNPWVLPTFNTFMMAVFAIVALGGETTDFLVQDGAGQLLVYVSGLFIGFAYGGTASGVATGIKTGVPDGPLQEFALGNSGFAVMSGSLLGSLISIPLEYWVSSVRCTQ